MYYCLSRMLLSWVSWVTNSMLATRGMLKVFRQTMVKHLTMLRSCSMLSRLTSPCSHGSKFLFTRSQDMGVFKMKGEKISRKGM